MSVLLRLPRGLAERSLDAIRSVGAGERETALFWLGDASTLIADTAVLPAGGGVRWHPLSLRLSESWMLALAELCDQRSQIVLGAVHSHPETAFMSLVDRDAFFHAPEFVSVVVPSYGRTRLADAASTWGVFIGTPGNRWRTGRWGGEIELVGGDGRLVKLEV
jgi:hypothetical protein